MTTEDLRQIEALGITEQTVAEQIDNFKKGFPWLKIVAPATPERGIHVLGEEEAKEAVSYLETAEVAGKCKFVPASGAASRMFKDLFSGLEKAKAGADIKDSPAGKFVDNIER